MGWGGVQVLAGQPEPEATLLVHAMGSPAAACTPSPAFCSSSSSAAISPQTVDTCTPQWNETRYHRGHRRAHVYSRARSGSWQAASSPLLLSRMAAKCASSRQRSTMSRSGLRIARPRYASHLPHTVEWMGHRG